MCGRKKHTSFAKRMLMLVGQKKSMFFIVNTKTRQIEKYEVTDAAVHDL